MGSNHHPLYPRWVCFSCYTHPKTQRFCFFVDSEMWRGRKQEHLKWKKRIQYFCFVYLFAIVVFLIVHILIVHIG